MFSQGTVYTNQGIEQWVLHQQKTLDIPTWRGWQIKNEIERRNRRLIVRMDTRRNGTANSTVPLLPPNPGFTISLNGTSEDVIEAKALLTRLTRYHRNITGAIELDQWQYHERNRQQTQIARVRNTTMCSMVNWK